ncbi:MAG TPA: methylmalonyl-CoA mutase family protein, partial [Thermoplasmata archaeon]|nr:methylmalonyl-CoA mutase family protein [Thermoplasmata archaeon]
MSASRPLRPPSSGPVEGESNDSLRTRSRQWEAETLAPVLAKNPERKDRFTTLGGIPVERVYTPLNSHRSFERIGYPGQPPFTRGIHPTMYRGRVWSMRMFSGFGTPEDTNRRFRYLLKHGESGLSIAFDDPTLYGLDADDPEALGEVGKCGVNVSSLDDMRRLLAGIPLADVTTSMTINAPANILWGMYLLAATASHVPFARLGGTTQNDILKEYIAQKEFLYPPRHALRLVTDTIEFGTRSTPRWNPVSISGYHIREAGSTAVQELAFTLADGRTYVAEAKKRGLDVDEFAQRLSFFFNSHNDFFEEIAKFRAARKIWAETMRDRYGARDERSWKLRTHAQTAGCSLTWQQPYNNIVRTTLQALAAVLGGTQSLHTNSLDEAYALPSEHAVTIALRTQQVIAYESGVPEEPDPLGGSYFIENLTADMEKRAIDYIRRIDDMGGMIP